MKSEVVVELVKLLRSHGIDVVLDGGWAVDALLGRETRPHGDLDIAVPHRDVPRIREILDKQGFREIARDDSRDCNFVLQDEAANQIDVHSYTFDENGKNVYGIAYLPEHFTGKGVINDVEVKCISPQWLIKFHTGYEIDENDFHDVKLLCEKFRLEMPDEYENQRF